ncbi:MAG TPA: hypothetical protein H9850_02440 [Candidatus Anaerobiospirillum pullistercoris]|uniref:Uncharacterized protein n=1 Tax=Candidatus Anaerobiospirillum pullistercoris TaxID=2838452 RepID=A0A9D1WC33_9GAMM|nr:hypothetical protein [Candidatus Anaerobiospirillum pullistercoris]
MSKENSANLRHLPEKAIVSPTAMRIKLELSSEYLTFLVQTVNRQQKTLFPITRNKAFGKCAGHAV